MKAMFIRLYVEEHGAVMVEYALMAALIAAAAAATVRIFGGAVGGLIQSAVDSFGGGDAPSVEIDVARP